MIRFCTFLDTSDARWTTISSLWRFASASLLSLLTVSAWSDAVRIHYAQIQEFVDYSKRVDILEVCPLPPFILGVPWV